MIKTLIRDLMLASLVIIIHIYGTFSLFTEVLRTLFPIGVILTLILTSLFYFLRVPAPPASDVEAILGKEPRDVADSNEFVIKTVAHRGAGLDAPENSLIAFKMCNENGINTIEFDVTLTKDDKPVVFHDSSLERMTDSKTVVNETNWSELSDVDISVKHLYRDRFIKTNIPTLEQTVTQLLASGQRMFIDIKDNNMKMVKVIHGLFKTHPELYTKAVVSTFYPNIIYFIRKGDPKIVCSMAYRPHFFAYKSYAYPDGKGERRSNVFHRHYFLELCDALHSWAFPNIVHYLLGLSVILLHKDAVSSKSVVDWRNKGVRVMAWTVNSPAEKQYFARVLKITYLTDTLTGEGTTHYNPS